MNFLLLVSCLLILSVILNFVFLYEIGLLKKEIGSFESKVYLLSDQVKAANEQAEIRVKDFKEAFNHGYETINREPAFYPETQAAGSFHISDEEAYKLELEQLRQAQLDIEDDGTYEERIGGYYD